jgi:gluconolactonase
MRTYSKSLFCLIVFFGFSLFLFAQESGIDAIIAKGAKLEKVADGFQFTEGPVADKKGNIYFTDQPNDRILKWDNKKGLSVFLQPCGRSNGLAFDKEGNIWACADEKNEIWKISPDKKIEKITGMFDGKAYNGPNDLWITSSGGIYFTDPFYKRTYWDHQNMPQPLQGVYYIFPDHKKVIRVVDDLRQPNGIVATPDGKNLYIADIGARKTWEYTMNPDGSLTNKKLFCEMGSDGMTIDTEGNIYLCGSGVTVFDKTGKQLGKIQIPESWTGNVTFGDKDLRSLYITASKSLYRIRLNVKGTR